MSNGKFEEIADYGDNKFFIRDFGSVIITDEDTDEEKEIPLVVIAEINDYFEATGEDEFEEKPFVVSMSILPRIDFIAEKHKKSASDSEGIEEDEIQYTDIMGYMGGVPIISDELNERFAEIDEAEEFVLSDDTRLKLNARAMMVGFYLDGAINRVGDTRWSYLEKMING